jgi:hypothetical protein
MRRMLLLVAIASVLVAVGWSAGRAQPLVADFSVSVDAPPGQITVTCSKGCDWPAEPGTPPRSIRVNCDRRPCQVMFNGRGRITVGMPLATAPR